MFTKKKGENKIEAFECVCSLSHSVSVVLFFWKIIWKRFAYLAYGDLFHMARGISCFLFIFFNLSFLISIYVYACNLNLMVIYVLVCMCVYVCVSVMGYLTSQRLYNNYIYYVFLRGVFPYICLLFLFYWKCFTYTLQITGFLTEIHRFPKYKSYSLLHMKKYYFFFYR